MGHAPFPEEERVGLNHKVSKNIEASGNSSENVSRKPIQRKGGKNPITYADAVRTRTKNKL